MFSTKNLVHNVKDVPSSWVFQHYLNIDYPLTGQSVKIKSIWTNERTPSCCLYVNQNQYVFKDFSSGKQGDKITLVMEKYKIPFNEACDKIIADYNSKSNIKFTERLTPDVRYNMDSISYRSWRESDANYWTQYNISSELLDRYCVKPVKEYLLSKEINGELNTVTIKNNYLYAYCAINTKMPYKIYQPYSKQYKFFKVSNYIQGLDQLESKPNLCIMSSMKDVLTMTSFNLNIDCIAGDSENTIIKELHMEVFKRKYNKIITFMDNDEGGRKSITMYKEKYGIKGTLLPLEKDVSDSVKKHGALKVRNMIIPLLKETIYGK